MEVSKQKTNWQRQQKQVFHQEGCRKCKKDDDHANLLLCEMCDAEYHTYCLVPPLTRIPSGDWFCDQCKPKTKYFINQVKDNLDEQVAALPPLYTSRFGEIIWAAGGQGFGWWPACIYDPRLTADGARKLAMKQLGKKHLVYFFACNDAPFTVLSEGKIMPWEDGLLEDFDSGKTARAISKNKGIMFEHALQTAIAEYDKPVEYRLDWNHGDNSLVQNGPAPSGRHGGRSDNYSVTAVRASSAIPLSDRSNIGSAGGGGKKRARNVCVPVDNKDYYQQGDDENPSNDILKNKKTTISRNTVNVAIETLSNGTNEIEEMDNGEFFCRILWISSAKLKCIQGVSNRPIYPSSPDCNPCPQTPGTPLSIAHNTSVDETINYLGFISLPCKKRSTFSDARRVIIHDLDKDFLPSGTKWKFYVPNLGPVSTKQESTLGPMLGFLLRTTKNDKLGEGSSQNPLKVFIFRAENSQIMENTGR